MKSAWCIEELPFLYRSHSIVRLAFRTENRLTIIFEQNKQENVLMNNETTLTAWDKLNEKDEIARQFIFDNLPDSYSYDSKTKQRIKRIFFQAIGQIVSVSPRDVGHFYTKLILHPVKGATCLEDLRIHENVSYNT